MFSGVRQANLYFDSLGRALSPDFRPLLAFLLPPSFTEGVALTAAEAEYLDTLAKAVAEINDANASIGLALSRVFPTRGALVLAIEEADVDGATRRLLDTLQGLTPPDLFREEHSNLVQFLSGFFATHDTQAALDAGDLLRVTINRRDLLLGYRRLAHSSSRSFCNAAADFGETICNPSGAGGEYGDQLREALNFYLTVEFGPRVTSFPLGLTQDEVFEGILLINREIEEVLAEAGQKVRALQPPPEYQADHAAIVTFLEEILGVAQAITKAAEDRDVQAQQLQFRESGTVLCNAVRALSNDIRPVLGPHLAPNPACSSL